jgi:hypothetical protein
LHVLAIGQADAMILELPSGRLAVVDFGHPMLLDYIDHLDPRGERRFAFCALTHVHHDHFRSLSDFIDRFDRRVDEYWYSFSVTHHNPILQRFKHAVMARNRRGRLIIHDAPSAVPLSLETDVDVVRFGPTTWEAEHAAGDSDNVTENNRSIVLLIRYGQSSLLLGADAEEARWHRIAAQARNGGLSLAADVVKAPHHGARAPHGLPESLWPLVCRSPRSYVVLTVDRLAGKPDGQTIQVMRRAGQIGCTGRALTCRLPTTELSGQARAASVDPPDLIAQALQPAPEAMATPACFGTQTFDCSPDGAITYRPGISPPFLDACFT